MLDMILVGFISLVQFIGGMISTVLLGLLALGFIKANKDLIKQCFTVKAIAGGLFFYFMLVMIIGLAPMHH